MAGVGLEGVFEDLTECRVQEKQLKGELEELLIEIEQKKRQQEVANLTGSIYFREVQPKISNVNLDDFWSSEKLDS